MYNRLNITNIGFDRPEFNTNYLIIEHERHINLNKNRWALIKNNRGNHQNEGLNTVKYKLVRILAYPLFTKLDVEVDNQTKVLWKLETLKNT